MLYIFGVLNKPAFVTVSVLGAVQGVGASLTLGDMIHVQVKHLNRLVDNPTGCLGDLEAFGAAIRVQAKFLQISTEFAGAGNVSINDPVDRGFRGSTAALEQQINRLPPE